MVFAVFVGVCPVERFIWFGRTAKGDNHGSIDFLHHFSLRDEEFVFSRRGRGQLAENEGVFAKFGGDEPVETGGCGGRVDVWIDRLGDKSVFMH